jgi:hypothetical protein
LSWIIMCMSLEKNLDSGRKSRRLTEMLVRKADQQLDLLAYTRQNQ